jgi:tetratricopeptide (TPR) repeat protein
MRTLLSTAAVVALLCAAPIVAAAQEADDAETTKMAKEHYKLGLEAYKAGQYETAIKELKKAYLLKRLPPLLLNIGATYRKMGDFDLALHFYRKYLDEAPPEARDRAEVEATIKEIEAEKAGGAAPKEATPPPVETPTETKEEAPPPPKRRSNMPAEFTHNVIDAAPPDTPMDVRVSMPVMKGVKVYVFYRGAGESDFQQVLMKRRGTEKVGRIPAEAMNGKALQYYIEARDPQGQVVKSTGSQSSPNIVMIDPSAKPQIVASMSTEERAPRETAPEPAEAEEGKGRRHMDEEEAPLLVEQKGKKRHAGPGEPSARGPLFWAGIAVMAVGVGAIAGGIACNVLAQRQADAVTKDAKQMQFEFKDPTAPNGQDDASFQSKGKLYNGLGIGLTVGGGVLAATGITLVVVDVLKHRAPEEKSKRRRAPVEESWYVAPTAGAAQVGVGGGFSF